VTIFKRGQAPAAVQTVISDKDIEAGEKEPVVTGD